MVAMPLPGKQRDHRPGLHRRLGTGLRSEIPGTLGDIDQLVFVQYPSAAGHERVVVRMGRERVLRPRRNKLVPDRRDDNAPFLVLIPDRQVT